MAPTNSNTNTEQGSNTLHSFDTVAKKELMELLDMPLAVESPEPAFDPAQRKGKAPATLAPRRITMKARGAAASRPTTGVLSPRKAVAKKLISEKEVKSPPTTPRKEHVETIYNKFGDVAAHRYTTVGSPAKPITSPGRFQAKTHGIGKQIRPLTSSDRRELEESSYSSPSKSSIRRHIPPPSIKSPGGHYESSDEDSPNTAIKTLRSEMKELKLENKELQMQVAETHIDMAEMRDDYTQLRQAMTSKVRRVYKNLDMKDDYNAK